MKFQPGQVVATRAVADLMAESTAFSQFTQTAFARYQHCDWGDLGKDDAEMNDSAVANGDDRIFASYAHPDHSEWKLWIITEWDRSATTLLFPSDY